MDTFSGQDVRNNIIINIKRHRFISLFILIVLLFAGCGETATPEKVGEGSSSAAQTENTTKIETFKIGDAISIGDYLFMVNSTRTSKGSDFTKPDDGNIWNIIDATVENKSDEPVSISSLLMFTLSDKNGYSYNPTFGADTKGNFDGELTPGRKMRGELAYEVPDSVSGFELIFDADVWGSVQAIVKLDR